MSPTVFHGFARSVRHASHDRSRARRLCWAAERLEDRRLLSAVTVTGVGDDINPSDAVP